MRDLDLVQWRALVAASIKTDLRTTGHSLDFGGAARGTSALIGTFLVIFLMGLGIAVFIAFSPDLFLSATLHVFVLAFVIASSLLIEFQAVVLSPADARQLSFQPVSSRTFLAARLTSVLVYVGGMTLAFLVGPLIAFTLTSHGGPLVSLAAAGTSIAAAVTVTLAVICIYVGVLRFVSPRRLTSALSYLQLLFGFVVDRWT